MSDDPTEDLRHTLAVRTGNLCSNPDCRTLLSVSPVAAQKGLEFGAVVQIAEADPQWHREEGIWLCQNCASLVVNNSLQYPSILLRAWKTVAEHRVRFPIAKKAFGTRLPLPVRPETKSQQKTLAIIPWRGKIVTLSESVAGDTATEPGSKLHYSLVRVLDCTESNVTVSRTGTEGRARSISLENVDLRIDATGDQLELRIRCA